MSPSAPKPYCAEIKDPPEKFDVEQHQIDVFRAGVKGNELWEYLEEIEKLQKTCKGKLL